MMKFALSLAIIGLLSTLAVGNAASWKPSADDYVKQSAASSIQQDATNFLLLNEQDYDKHLAEKPVTEKASDERMQCLRRVQAYRCN
jgi:type II secretory pathway pseudopilin PulG